MIVDSCDNLDCSQDVQELYLGKKDLDAVRNATVEEAQDVEVNR